jgi:phosphoribosylformylglycinamidine cyclo-ligase
LIKKATYKSSGVDIDAGARVAETAKELARSTSIPGVIGSIGGFAGLFQIPPGQYKDPILVSGTDGVGTKLKVAFQTDIHDTIGIDLVAMCVNDILTVGARPLFFLDYYGCQHVDVDVSRAILKGIAEGCRQAGCALLGGETAELSDMYEKGEYDLAGFAVGVVERDKMIDGSKIRGGDILVGVASSGVHSNGFSLARKALFDMGRHNCATQLPGFLKNLGEELLTPTKIYVKPVLSLLESLPIRGLVHITGGGLLENVPRVLPPGVRAGFHKNSWPIPRIFDTIQQEGNIDEEEMYRVFNMGVGLVIVIPEESALPVVKALEELGEAAYVIGRIESGDGGVTFAE